MSCRVWVAPSVLWAMFAGCSPPAAPAAKPAVAVSPAPTVAPVAAPSVPAAPAQPVIAAPARPSTVGWKSFEDGELVGFKDAQGKVVVPPRFQVAQEFSAGGMACGADKDGWVCIDGNGTTLLRPFLFDNGPDEFSEGLARFVDGEKIGFFDAAGNKKIPARYSFARPFAGERAAFCDGCTRRCEAGGEHCSMVGGKWGLLDKTGAEVVPASFDEIGEFTDGKAQARRAGAEITIDRDGKPSGG